MKYIYISTKDGKKIGGCLEARHSFEALHNARFLSLARGGSARELQLIKIS